MKYRREIDGLRAIAVLPVILFHAGFEIFSGGYIGVDVFFVISGYLITTIILKEKTNGTFTIARFYARRARRILPALIVVMLACIPFAWIMLLPSQFADFSESLVAVVLFASNILFWSEHGYFSPAAEVKPLLHTWSLAVEEQYYLFFPVFMIIFWRIGKFNIACLVALCCAASFGLAEYASHYHPIANFFLTPMRAWELLAGSLTAFLLDKRDPKSSNLLSLAGLGMIITAIFIYDSATRWPSAYSLVPVIGTTLIILFTTPSTVTYKILAIRGLVGIGLISYSAYLWHQPLFAFARTQLISEPPQTLMSVLAIATILIAWLSWRYVETPFRHASLKASSNTQHSFAAISLSAVLVGIGLFGFLSHGVPSRIESSILKVLEAKEDANPKRNSCLINDPADTPPPKAECWLNKSPNKSTVILGDSHADSISHELSLALQSFDLNIQQYTYGGCIPISGLRRLDATLSHKCAGYNSAIFDWLSASKNIDTVLLLARWTLYFEGTYFKNEMGAVERDSSGVMFSKHAGVDLNAADGKGPRKMRVRKAIKKHVQALLALGKNVIIVYSIPEAGWNVPETMAKQALARGKLATLDTSLDVFLKRNSSTFHMLASTEHPNLYHFHPHNFLCSEHTRRCLNADENGVYYMDGNHLSNSGARLISKALAETINTAKTTHSRRFSEKSGLGTPQGAN